MTEESEGKFIVIIPWGQNERSVRNRRQIYNQMFASVERNARKRGVHAAVETLRVEDVGDLVTLTVRFKK